MKFNQTQLSNGLTVIGEVRESAVSVAVGFFVKTGARDESKEISGVSHFLEHMMFKGTEKRSALDITYALGAIGAQANAYTTEETTVYYAAVLPEYLEEVTDILSDMLRPSLDDNEFATEKKVILEEIALYQDRPTYRLFESALREYFAGHSAGNSVLGSVETVSVLTAEQMRRYFDARYCAGNIVLAASGNFDWNEFVDLANRYCGQWGRQTAQRDVLPHTPEENLLVLTKENLQMAHMCFVAPGPPAKEMARYPAHVWSCVTGDAVGSRAYWALIDPGLADTVGVDVDDMDGTGIVMSYLSGEPDKLDEVGEILLGIIKTPKEFSDDELARAKTKIATRVVLQGESSMRRLMAIGNDWIYREEYLTLQEELERIKQVARDDINKMLDQYPSSPFTTVKLIPAA